MRKSYTLTTKVRNEVAQEKTYYRVLREEDNKTVLGTVVDSDDVQIVLNVLSDDLNADTLLESYYGDGSHDLYHISFKQYPNGQTGVRLYFDEVTYGSNKEQA